MNHLHVFFTMEDPETGHTWEMCLCGYYLDVTEMKGSAA